MMEKFDVAVIGAGIAGITAARDLSKKGFSVVLLEARDRLGGRTYLEKGLGDEIELGGAYVHWTQPHVWNELQHHGISLLPPLTASKAYWLADGTVHSGTEEEYYEAVGPAMKQLFADARERFPLPFMINAVDNSDVERESIEDRINSLGLSAYHRDVLDGALAAFAPIGKHPINATRTERYHDGDTLIMCICSDAAAIRADNREAVQAALRRFIPAIEVVDTASHSWTEDEFSKGGWMMHRPGHLTGGAAQIRQGHSRIRFARSDIAGLDAGAIEGAMESAAAAARDVAAALATSNRSIPTARPRM